MCHIQGSGFRIQGLGFRVWVLGFLRVIWGNSLSIQPKDPRKQAMSTLRLTFWGVRTLSKVKRNLSAVIGHFGGR